MLKPRNPRSGGLNLRSAGKRLAEKNSLIRTCRFEQLEDRRMLAPVPTILIDDVQQGGRRQRHHAISSSRSPAPARRTVRPRSATPPRPAVQRRVTITQATSGTLVFAAKETHRDHHGTGHRGHRRSKSDETFYVDLTIIDNGQFGISRGVGTIVNDDTGLCCRTWPSTTCSWSRATAVRQAMVFTVTRSGDLSQPSTVDYSTADGTATTS